MVHFIFHIRQIAYINMRGKRIGKNIYLFASPFSPCVAFYRYQFIYLSSKPICVTVRQCYFTVTNSDGIKARSIYFHYQIIRDRSYFLIPAGKNKDGYP